MLSILIPIYNFAVKELVNELSSQAQDLKIPFEILCVDDNSKATYIKINDGLEKIKGVNYQLNKKNIGRSAIRNLLTDKAKFDYLLFLDCDVKIGDDFIKKYIDFKDESEVIVGGVSYNEYEQLEKNKRLRWKYGRHREERKAHYRNQRPYASFSACNLFINKKVSQKIRFTESLTKYGHEDTIYGAELEFNSYTVMHINNPIIHLGLDEVSVFLEKTEFALINLLSLEKSHLRACKNIKIFNYYNFIKKTLFLTKGIFIFWKYSCRKLLMNGSTNLVVFDLYKLSFMICLKKD
tara:strand:+ start:715 stop:1596 length:882 start_codon:yes stop_codon:yes gene_type:complete